MNIFGVGGWELAAILIITLIIAGPKRMARWAYILGQFAGQLRVMWSDMMAQVQREFDDAGVDIEVPKNLPSRSDINRSISKAFEPVSKPVNEAVSEINEEARAVGRGMEFNSNGNGYISKKSVQQEDLLYTVEPPPEKTEKPQFGTWSGVGKHEDEDGDGTP